ncbi:MAG: hypothetical protein RR505_05855, partial [Raoultibacter sp.]
IATANDHTLQRIPIVPRANYLRHDSLLSLGSLASLGVNDALLSAMLRHDRRGFRNAILEFFRHDDDSDSSVTISCQFFALNKVYHHFCSSATLIYV